MRFYNENPLFHIINLVSLINRNLACHCMCVNYWLIGELDWMNETCNFCVMNIEQNGANNIGRIYREKRPFSSLYL